MGKFQLSYQSYTHGQFCYELSNCKGSHELEIKTFDCQYRNEAFDEVRVEKYQCLGHWPSDFPGKYFGVMKSENQYKCFVSIFQFIFSSISLSLIFRFLLKKMMGIFGFPSRIIYFYVPIKIMDGLFKLSHSIEYLVPHYLH